MREIKFRVWDKERKQWLQQYEYVLGMINGNLVVYRASCEEQDGTEEYVSSIDFADEITGRVEVVEYTGLHDKNGKEIYKGDICSYSDWKPKVIEWRDGRFWLGDTLVIVSKVECDMMEVIGNVQETRNT